MLLTITSTTPPATDLGYLLHKNPERPQSFDLSFGRAHVFYPEAGPERCTAALWVEVDPVGLVRGRGPGAEGASIDAYVNDRPYAASSFLSVALGEVFSTALSGRSKERPELAARALPLEATLPVLPCRGGEAVLRRLFEPLGYEVAATNLPLDEAFPDWGPSRYFRTTFRGNVRLAELLAHLYVLVPVADGTKHYWVGDEEVEKLLRRGEGWLGAHPERELIASRYLKHQRSLVREALDRLLAEEMSDPESSREAGAAQEASLEARTSLAEERIGAVVAAIRKSGARRVLDLGCGEGRLLRALLEDRQIEEAVGLDVSTRALEIAADRLRLDRLPERERARVKLLPGSLMYRDSRLAGFDAAAVVEVIEHLDPPRLAAFERVVFEHARPRTVVVTTPNAEYNVRYETLPAGRFRHADHRFEWTRAEFRAWAEGVAARWDSQVRFVPVGDVDAEVGSPTQMAVFSR